MASNGSSGGGGLLGALSQLTSSGLLGDIGTGLLAASHYGANPGVAMEQALAAGQQRRLAQQQYQMNQFSLARQAMMLPFMQAYFNGAMGGGATQSPQQQAPAQAAPAAPSAPVVGAYSAAPQAASAAPAPNLSQFTAPSPQQISSMSIGGMSPDLLRLGGILAGQSPLATAQQLRQQQLALAQQQYGPVIARLDTLTKAQSPTQYVKADPALYAEWNRLAPGLGFDPTKDFTDANARTAFSFLRNRIAGALTEGTVAPPVQQQTISGPLGAIFSRNPVTNALSQVKPEEALKMVVGPNGPQYVPASRAAGQQAFSPETYVNPQTTSQLAKLIANYEAPPLNGYALRTPQGQAIMAAVQAQNPKYDATTYAVKQQARERFATGKQGDIVRSLSVATNHLDQLSQAFDALHNGNKPLVNRLVNRFATEMGSPNVTSLNAMSEIVGDEVTKAVLGSSGAESDREAIKDAFSAAASNPQFGGVISHYKGLMGGQLSGLRRQYSKATGLNDFDSFVSQMAQQQLGQANTAPAPLTIGQSATIGGFRVTRIK